MLRAALCQALSKPHRRASALSTSASHGLPTPLLSRHVKLQGQLVEYAGYALPILYTGKGVLKEHLHTRSSAGLFDVSHMGQVCLYGRDRVAFMEEVVVSDVAALKVGEACLTVLCNERGGVLDDAIVANAGDHLFLVVNGACKHKDVAHIRNLLSSSSKNKRVTIEELPDATLIALQGPRAAEVLQPLLKARDLGSMAFMTGFEVDVAGVPCRVTRCGYTGEDGFEISARERGPEVYDALLSSGVAEPAGLGARDSLRLEAGLCLYGNELSEDILPVEAGLGWVIGKRRRAEGGFVGAAAVLKQFNKDTPPLQKRVGLTLSGAPARGGAVIFSGDTKVGTVTSGTFSPTLKQPLAMGYVASEHAKTGAALTVDVRGKRVPAVVTKLPFVPSHYYKPPQV
jgi:aminomethyltransferase